MSQINVDIIASQSTGDVTVNDPLKVDVIDPSTGSAVTVSGVPISSPNLNDVLIGEGTGQNVTTAFGNIAIGTDALSLNTESPFNIAVGTNALKNTYDPLADSNVAIGHNALINNQNGNSNVAIGNSALPQSVVSNNNTAIGNSSGNLFNLGYNNVFLGATSGPYLTTGDQNIFIGVFSGGILGGPTYQASGNNNIHIGYNTRPASNTASNAITLGNSSHNVLRCAVTTITSLSDERDKKDIKELGAGLDFVKGLKPVEFVWNDRDDEVKRDIKDFGFIAQDLKKSQEDAELADTLKLVYEENPEKLEASYGKLVPILVKAIQELTAKVEALEAK